MEFIAAESGMKNEAEMIALAVSFSKKKVEDSGLNFFIYGQTAEGQGVVYSARFTSEIEKLQALYAIKTLMALDLITSCVTMCEVWIKQGIAKPNETIEALKNRVFQDHKTVADMPDKREAVAIMYQERKFDVLKGAAYLHTKCVTLFFKRIDGVVFWEEMFELSGESTGLFSNLLYTHPPTQKQLEFAKNMTKRPEWDTLSKNIVRHEIK